MKLLSFFLFACLCFPASGGSIRLRLREHFALTHVNYGQAASASRDYTGLTNTANLWYEEPFHYAIGLSWMPILGSSKIKSSQSPPPGTSDKVRMWNIGIEGKYFFFPDELGFFGRGGLHFSRLDVRGSLGGFSGFGYYVGVGWEFKVWKLGISPEFAFRHAFLSQGVRVTRITPSLAVAFYLFQESSEAPQE